MNNIVKRISHKNDIVVFKEWITTVLSQRNIKLTIFLRYFLLNVKKKNNGLSMIGNNDSREKSGKFVLIKSEIGLLVWMNVDCT